MIAAANGSGITPIVRVGELLYSLVARLLDSGAQGIILPRVEDPKILEEALSWMRFPPMGKRGYGVNTTMIGYESHGFKAIIEHQNLNTLSVVQFESRLAIERADELLSIPGLDIAMVGPADLSINLGIPGDFENPATGMAWSREFRRAAPGWRRRGWSVECALWARAPSTDCCSKRPRKPWAFCGHRTLCNPRKEKAWTAFPSG
jgi:2-keto-3-deoxy-L-rhamnonate aldolase RhmA